MQVTQQLTAFWQESRSVMSQIQSLERPNSCSSAVKKLQAKLLSIVVNRQRAIEGMARCLYFQTKGNAFLLKGKLLFV